MKNISINAGLETIIVLFIVTFILSLLILFLTIIVKKSWYRNLDHEDMGIIIFLLFVFAIIVGIVADIKLGNITRGNPDNVIKKITTENLISIEGGYLKLEYPYYGGPIFMFCSIEGGGQEISVSSCNVAKSSGSPRLEICNLIYEKKFYFFKIKTSEENKTFFVP